MVVSSRVSAQRNEPVNNPSSSPSPPPTTKPDNARKALTRTCDHNSPEALSSKKECNTARGAGKKRLGRIPAEDAHCQTINNEMGTTQGNACFTRACGRNWALPVEPGLCVYMAPHLAFGLRLHSRYRRLQGRVADVNVFGNQLEVVEGVSDLLLLRAHGVGDGFDSIAAARKGQLKRGLIQTNAR